MRSTTVLGLRLLFGASLALAACGTSGVGYDQPPASLDPSAPKLVANNLDFNVADVDVPS